MDKVEAYQEILDALEKHSDVFVGDYDIDIRSKLYTRIRLQEISNLFGIPVPPTSGDTYIPLSNHQSISLYGPAYNRIISWSDDGSQPEDEWLYCIIFPAGAYIYGEEYPTRAFNNFFVELKSYHPKYTDTANNALFFTYETAKDVHEAFDGIYKKHKALVDDELKKKRINKLKEELAYLEQS